MAKNKSLSHYFLISLIYITILSNILKGVVLSTGVLILFILFIGLFCYFAIRKSEMFLSNRLVSAASSIPFLFLIISAKEANALSLRINFKEEIWSSLGMLGFAALICLLIIFFIVKKSFMLFRHPIDFAFIAALAFIVLFSPLIHLAGITPEQQDFSVDYPLFVSLAKVLIIYLSINILLREAMLIKALLILQLISLLIILVLL